MIEKIKFPSQLDELSYNEVKTHRAEVRNGKIIMVIEPKIMSSQVFAVNPFYTEGDEKNQLQDTQYIIKVTEKNGEIKKFEAEYSNSLSHFTKGHTQIHCGMRNLFKSKIETAVYEILTTKIKYILDDSRMKKLIDLLDSDEERNHAIMLIEKRKQKHKEDIIYGAKERLIRSMKDYEAALTGELENAHSE